MNSLPSTTAGGRVTLHPLDREREARDHARLEEVGRRGCRLVRVERLHAHPRAVVDRRELARDRRPPSSCRSAPGHRRSGGCSASARSAASGARAVRPLRRLDRRIGEHAVECRGREVDAVEAQQLRLQPCRAKVALAPEREHALGHLGGARGVGEAVGPAALRGQAAIAVGLDPAEPFAQRGTGDAAASAGDAGAACLAVGLDPDSAGLEGLGGVAHGRDPSGVLTSLRVETMSPTPTYWRHRPRYIEPPRALYHTHRLDP